MRINSYLWNQHLAPLGHVDAELYTFANNPRPFPTYHDITVGNNSGANVGFSAGPVYDLVTGLGTPNAWNIAQDAAAARFTNGVRDVYIFSGNQVSVFTGQTDLGLAISRRLMTETSASSTGVGRRVSLDLSQQ